MFALVLLQPSFERVTLNRVFLINARASVQNCIFRHIAVARICVRLRVLALNCMRLVRQNLAARSLSAQVNVLDLIKWFHLTLLEDVWLRFFEVHKLFVFRLVGKFRLSQVNFKSSARYNWLLCLRTAILSWDVIWSGGRELMEPGRAIFGVGMLLFAANLAHNIVCLRHLILVIYAPGRIRTWKSA